MTNPKIYVGTIGADVEILSHADLVTGVLSVAITVQKPSGATANWTPDTIDEDGTIHYQTRSGDLDEAGIYTLQQVATMTNENLWPLGAAQWKIWPRFGGY